MATDDKEIITMLNSIKEELDYIKENMVEKDEIITDEELEALKKSYNRKNSENGE